MASTFKITSNAYKGRYLELSLTQTRNISANTSTIAWTLKVVGGDSNYYSTGPTTAKLGNTQLCYYARKSYSSHEFPSGPPEASKSGTVTVNHNADGTLTLPVSLTTAIYTTTTSTKSGSWELDAIPRASSITSAGAVILGNSCNVTWKPNSASFWFKLRFSLGGWSHTIDKIHPNKTSAHTYTEYTIPLDEVAPYITNDDEGTMTVTLTTYTDSGYKNSAGSDSETFKVTVPANSSTKPTVTMTLAPAETPFAGLYLQEVSKVQATLNATGKLGASIKSYSMTADGGKHEDPYVSNYLKTPGAVEITGTAVDSRGISGTTKQTITVLPYYKPKLKNVKAYRCDSKGIAAENGEYLKIEATRDYAKVMVDGVQMNFCKIRYRYKAENAEKYSEYETILETDAEGDTVETLPLLDATFDKSLAYLVEINVVDTADKSEKGTTVSVSIPSERIFRHKRPGGRGLGLGGYCEEDDLLDVYWNQRVRGDLQVDGKAAFPGGVAGDLAVEGNVSGAYIRPVRVWDTNTFRVQSKYPNFNDGGGNRQSIFLFGSMGGDTCMGVISINSAGGCSWNGTTGNTVAAEEGGIVCVTLKNKCYDHFVLISAEPISIV